MRKFAVMMALCTFETNCQTVLPSNETKKTVRSEVVFGLSLVAQRSHYKKQYQSIYLAMTWTLFSPILSLWRRVLLIFRHLWSQMKLTSNLFLPLWHFREEWLFPFWEWWQPAICCHAWLCTSDQQCGGSDLLWQGTSTSAKYNQKVSEHLV